jgi:hypothetical protein
MQSSPHFLDRGLEALRQKQAKGKQPLAVAVQPQQHGVQVAVPAVPGAPRTALAVAQAAVQLSRRRPCSCSSTHSGTANKTQYVPMAIMRVFWGQAMTADLDALYLRTIR